MSGLAVCRLNIGQEKAQCTGPSAARLCLEYTLWAEQQASGTCSVAGQIKALRTALTRAHTLFFLPSSLTLTHIFTGPLLTSWGSCVPLKKIHFPQTLETKDSTGRVDEIIVGGSFPLQLCYNFSCGVESCMLKSFEGGTSCLPAVVVRVGGE